MKLNALAYLKEKLSRSPAVKAISFTPRLIWHSAFRCTMSKRHAYFAYKIRRGYFIMINEYSAHKRLETIFSCTVRAVNAGFKHLPVRFILNPPHRLFDAMLARQIVIHIVHHVFNIPRRRIVIALGRTRSAVSTSITTVNIRLNEPCFAREYDKWADKALSLFQRETNKLAEAA